MATEDIPICTVNICSGETNASAPSSVYQPGKDAAVVSGVVEDDSEGIMFPITCFSATVDDANFHFKIIRLPRQVYVWIGCNSSKLGNLYAAAPTFPNNAGIVTSVLGGSSDNISCGIARRLAMKSGLSVILASNIPKNNLVLEVNAEKKLVEKFAELGYVQKQ